MNRRVVVRGLLWAVGAGCLLLPVLDDPPLQTGAYVQDVRADSVVIAMVTAAPLQLLVGLAGPGDPIPAMYETLPARRHEVRMTGLRPGRIYEFTVQEFRPGSEGGRLLDRGSFRTPNDDDLTPVRFDVVGDSGAQPWWVWLQKSPLFHLPARWGWLPPHGRVTRMGEQILADEPEFVLHVGDVIYPWGYAGHYAPGFFRPFAEVLRRAPCYAVLGNHDVMDDDGRQALANFVLPRNEITGDERMYSIAWGSVRVVVLDTNETASAKQVLPPVDAGHVAVQFLKRELAAASEPWIVVTSHYPIETASRQGDRADLITHVLPLLREFGVNLYLCGHDHTYQRFGKDGDVAQVVSGGGGKSLYEVGQHANKRMALSQYHHCVVEVNGDQLALRAIDLDGKTIDGLKLTQGPKDIAAVDRIEKVNPERARRIKALW